MGIALLFRLSGPHVDELGHWVYQKSFFFLLLLFLLLPFTRLFLHARCIVNTIVFVALRAVNSSL